jgi:hypothetical protein
MRAQAAPERARAAPEGSSADLSTGEKTLPLGYQEYYGLRPIQMKAASASEAHDRAAASPGKPLPAQAQQKFEASLGTDLSQVRVHTDDAAATSSRAFAAHAYAQGSQLYFGAGKYDPSSASGERLLAHEVAHTVQQGGGGAPQAAREVRATGDPLEAEADAAADAMVAGRPATVQAGSASGVISRMAIGEIDKDAVVEELNDEHPDNMQVLMDSEIYACEGFVYQGKEIQAEGLTLPWLSPQRIYINAKLVKNNADFAATLFHEMQHAMDVDTPRIEEDTREAHSQDLDSEFEVTKTELEYRIKKCKAAGNVDLLEDAIKLKRVKEVGENEWEVDEDKLDQQIRGGDYKDIYAQGDRANRHDPANYVFLSEARLDFGPNVLKLKPNIGMVMENWPRPRPGDEV